MCPSCRAFITSRDKVCPYCNERVGPRAVERRDPGAILGGFIPHARFVTMIILTINIGLYLATVVASQQAGVGGAGVSGRTLFELGAKYRLTILGYGQWWRLVTAGFLHGGLMHIAWNSFGLFYVGTQAEEVYGASRFIVVYFLSTVSGFLLSTLVSDSLSMGASAGIMGLLGAMIALGVGSRRAPAGAAIHGSSFVYIAWAAYGIISGFLPGSEIDNAAHIGGLAAGFGAAYLAGTPRIETAPTERLWRWAAAACVVLTAVSFLKMYLWFVRATQ